MRVKRRKLRSISFVVGVLLAASQSAAAIPSGDASVSVPGSRDRAPALRLETRYPLTLSASGFLPRERIRVVVVHETGRLARHTRADLAGSLVVVFPRARVGRCEALSARAIGDRGSRARLRKTMWPACTE